MKLENIKRAYTENTGGGCLVDFLELDNGLLLAVSDEYVGLYRSVDDLYEGDGITGFWIQESLHKHQIDTKERHLQKLKDEILKISDYFLDFDTDNIIQERTGIAIKIESDRICFKYDDGVANVYEWQVPFFMSYDLENDLQSFFNLKNSSVYNFLDSIKLG